MMKKQDLMTNATRGIYKGQMQDISCYLPASFTPWIYGGRNVWI